MARHRFRVTYHVDGHRQAMLVDATDANAAIRVVGPYSGIIAVTMQCEATLTNGGRCKRFTSTAEHDRCHQHQPRRLHP